MATDDEMTAVRIDSTHMPAITEDDINGAVPPAGRGRPPDALAKKPTLKLGALMMQPPPAPQSEPGAKARTAPMPARPPPLPSRAGRGGGPPPSSPGPLPGPLPPRTLIGTGSNLKEAADQARAVVEEDTAQPSRKESKENKESKEKKPESKRNRAASNPPSQDPPKTERQGPPSAMLRDEEGPPTTQRGVGEKRPESSTKTAASALANARPPSIPPPPMDADRGPALAAPAQKPRSVTPPPPTSPTAGPRPGSLRPPPPPKKESRPPGALGALDGFDEGSIAHAFDALMSDRPSEPGVHDFDLSPVRELFTELAANHMRHVRDFMIDVKWGEVTRDWIEICVPPVRTLRRAAERLDLEELSTALDRVGKVLEAASSVGAPTLTDEEKTRLLDTYGELVTLMPQAFALDRDRSQREAVIVQALLLQVPDVKKVTIDKLHASGLTSLRELFDANAGDMAEVAGIPHALATKIVERVRAYREELHSSSPSDARAVEREKLAGLTTTLQEHHNAYEEAAKGWSEDAKTKKRDRFRLREETWLAISVLLARFGEVDRLRGIEKVPFAQRIAQLTAYLEEAAEKYRTENA